MIATEGMNQKNQHLDNNAITTVGSKKALIRFIVIFSITIILLVGIGFILL